MPNWCVGDLKVRGTKENIVKFLLEALEPINYRGASNEAPEIKKYEYELLVRLENSIFYLRGTRRSFIEQKCIEFYYPDEDDEIAVLVLEDYKSAWGVDVDGLRRLSEKYKIDFKILGFERGMEFNHDVEVVGGVVLKNEEIKFDNYKWECVSPSKGG